jgi:CheY-like chemotaxis protein/HJR/Mrr/RecB family endonuclease
MRVLFIDDEPRYVESYVEELRDNGFVVDFAKTNTIAIEFIRRGPPYDVIIQDIMRPPDGLTEREVTDFGMRTGVVFYESYLQRECPTTPVVFLSNNSYAFRQSNDVTSPFCTYLRKMDILPFELSEIIRGVTSKTLELLYQHTSENLTRANCAALVIDVRAEIKKYLSLHPEKLHELSPRRFEELVAEMLRDMGLDTVLTMATRDGGVDIYAYLRHEVTNFVMLVECKRWSPDNPVGIDVIQRLYGIQQTKKANKALVVTTSYFTEPAKTEAALHNGLIDLKDYQSLKKWLQRYCNSL